MGAFDAKIQSYTPPPYVDGLRIAVGSQEEVFLEKLKSDIFQDLLTYIATIKSNYLRIKVDTHQEETPNEKAEYLSKLAKKVQEHINALKNPGILPQAIVQLEQFSNELIAINQLGYNVKSSHFRQSMRESLSRQDLRDSQGSTDQEGMPSDSDEETTSSVTKEEIIKKFLQPARHELQKEIQSFHEALKHLETCKRTNTFIRIKKDLERKISVIQQAHKELGLEDNSEQLRKSISDTIKQRKLDLLKELQTLCQEIPSTTKSLNCLLSGIQQENSTHDYKQTLYDIITSKINQVTHKIKLETQKLPKHSLHTNTKLLQLVKQAEKQVGSLKQNINNCRDIYRQLLMMNDQEQDFEIRELIEKTVAQADKEFNEAAKDKIKWVYDEPAKFESTKNYLKRELGNIKSALDKIETTHTPSHSNTTLYCCFFSSPDPVTPAIETIKSAVNAAETEISDARQGTDDLTNVLNKLKSKANEQQPVLETSGFEWICSCIAHLFSCLIPSTPTPKAQAQEQCQVIHGLST